MYEYILALDLSSSTVGYSIFNKTTKELVDISYFKYPSFYKDLLEKGLYLEISISKLLKKYPNITELVIEERLKKFREGKSSADNILILAQLNYICQFLVKYKFNLKITEINVIKARGLVFPNIFKVTRQTKIKQKDFVFENVVNILGSGFFPTKVLKSGKNKGQTVFLEEAKDMSDAFLIAKAYFILYDQTTNKRKDISKLKNK